jgi:hypothetical protein
LASKNFELLASLASALKILIPPLVMGGSFKSVREKNARKMLELTLENKCVKDINFSLL